MTQPAVGQKETLSQEETIASIGNYQFGWHDSDEAGSKAKRGLNEEVVRDISARKGEPEWMLKKRLKALKLFERRPMPTWGADLSGIDFDSIKYYVKSTEGAAASWEDLPADIKATYDRLGIPEAEKERLVAGVAAQYESEVVYHKIREDLEQAGRHLPRYGYWPARIPRNLRGVLRYRDSAGRQQVRVAQLSRVVGRLVRLRPEGRARGDPASGLLPY